ncbi:hypothetical protein B0H14DRAFT_3425686 [Mycena olivaceomarginata]|nr:hypothetical protein B0H14DRAFT_3425686 [Mycena olivaceomarginata]
MDAPAAEEPVERRVNVLCEGCGHELYIAQSLIPFRGTQFRDRKHQLPLPAAQDPNDTAMLLTHMVKDLVDRISLGVCGIGGSFNQRVTQVFHPERCIRLPKKFEVGDWHLNCDRFIALETVHMPPSRPPILPSDGELSGFPLSYHFSGDMCTRLEERYPGGIAVQHADGKITSPIVAGGFDMSEDTLPHEETSSLGTRCASARGRLPPIDEETHAATSVFHGIHVGPQHTFQFFADVVHKCWEHGNFRWPAVCCCVVRHNTYSIRQWVHPHGFISLHISTLEMTPLTPSMARRVTSPLECAASADAGNEGSFDELNTGSASDVNGVSVGSKESGGAVVGSSAGVDGVGAKGAPTTLDTMSEGAVPQKFLLHNASEFPSGGWVEGSSTGSRSGSDGGPRYA